jgi:hypothetical protein
MVEGIHVPILEAFLGKGVLKKHFIGALHIALQRKGRKEITNTYKAGGKMIIVTFDVVFKILDGFGTEIIREEIEAQGHAITTLRGSVNMAIGADVMLVEGGFDLFEELFVLIRGSVVSDGAICL